MEAMRHATQLVRTRGPLAATRFIQALFRPGPRTRPATPVDRPMDRSASSDDGTFEVLDRPAAPAPREQPPPALLPGAKGRFLSGRFAAAVGARNHKLYVPSGYTGAPLPLVVMLHGCTQDPDDFAIGTRANRWAELESTLVVYPEQIQRANSHRCWNWFRPIDQRAGGGEPAIIEGIVRQVIGEYSVDARRVYVAGLSAGGAMAAIMAHAYPQLFAAVGIHSGLPFGAAHDVASALALMKTGKVRATNAATLNAPIVQTSVPMIVLHGDADATVNPANADHLVQSAIEARRREHPGSVLNVEARTVDPADGSYGYRRTIYTAAEAGGVIEQWQIHGAGHAWSGGDGAASYADARGPDATQAMFRFFRQHALPGRVVAEINEAPASM